MKLNSPKLPSVNGLELIDIRQFVTEASLEQVILSDTDGSGLQAKSLGLDEALLEKVVLLEAKLEKLSLSDVRLKTCDLSATRCAESSWIRVHISDGRMAGIDFSRSVLKDVVFENCKLDMANFRLARLTRVRFVDCMLNETDFQMAELSDVEFTTSHLEKVEFDHAKTKNVDARTSELIEIRGWQSLKGLTVDSTQLISIAPQLALELGLIIKD